MGEQIQNYVGILDKGNNSLFTADNPGYIYPKSADTVTVAKISKAGPVGVTGITITAILAVGATAKNILALKFSSTCLTNTNWVRLRYKTGAAGVLTFVTYTARMPCYNARDYELAMNNLNNVVYLTGYAGTTISMQTKLTARVEGWIVYK